MIFLGSYNHLLYGVSAAAGASSSLKQEFLHSTHAAKVNCVAASGPLLASGSDDTTVWVFRTSTRKEVGQLDRHQGSITSLAFYKNKHLLSASQDGTICVWRIKDWECIFQIKAHSNGVKSMSLHPTGRMALTLGESSKKAKLWNLLTGKMAVLFKLDQGLDFCLKLPSIKGTKLHLGRDFRDLPATLKWSPSGNLWAVQWTTQLDVYSASGSTKLPVKSIALESRLTCFCWVDEDVVVLGSEEGAITWVSLAAEAIARQELLGSRIKDLSYLDGAACAATSSGRVVLFRGDKPLEIDLDDRLTCLATVDNAEHGEPKVKPSKKKKAKKVITRTEAE